MNVVNVLTGFKSFFFFNSHVPVRLILESSTMLVAPSTSDAKLLLFELLLLQRVDVARARCGLFATVVHLELRYQVEGESLVLAAAWSIHVKWCLSQISMLFQTT